MSVKSRNAKYIVISNTTGIARVIHCRIESAVGVAILAPELLRLTFMESSLYENSPWSRLYYDLRECVLRQSVRMALVSRLYSLEDWCSLGSMIHCFSRFEKYGVW